ncbi:MAG: PQQ-dependent sugar dehydrogenase [Microthrixaceae bacterium]
MTAAASVALLAACSSSGPSATTTTTTTATTAPRDATSTTTLPEVVPLESIRLAATEVAQDLDRPTALAARPSTRDLYVAERAGRVRLIKVTESTDGKGSLKYELQRTPVLDISKDVLAGGERGLLGLAFSSDGRRLYVNFTSEPDGRTEVVEYEVGDKPEPDARSARPLLSVDQPAANHNGGDLVVGPDGYLYIALGDGGGQGDPKGRAQDRKDLLGKILRIDPAAGVEGDSEPYGIPAGNPFRDGANGAPEVWAYGLRNPWRFSFDELTGDLWIGDVGQNAWEEVDWLPATGGFDAGRGANLGWDQMEGTHSFEGDNPTGAFLPVLEYPHDGRCSVIGGYVYRGEAIDGLQGAYLYADYCQSGVRGLRLTGGKVTDQAAWPLEGTPIVSFGQDNEGELFVLIDSGSVVKLTPPERSAER